MTLMSALGGKDRSVIKFKFRIIRCRSGNQKEILISGSPHPVNESQSFIISSLPFGPRRLGPKGVKTSRRSKSLVSEKRTILPVTCSVLYFCGGYHN